MTNTLIKTRTIKMLYFFFFGAERLILWHVDPDIDRYIDQGAYYYFYILPQNLMFY